MVESVQERSTIGAIWVAIETWGGQLAQFVVFLLLARLLGPEAYGLVNIALIMNIVGTALIVEGGWVEAIIQQRDLESRHINSVFWALLAFGGGLALVAIIAGEPLAWLFRRPDLALLVACLAPALPLQALAIVPEALLCRDMRFGPLAARSLIATLTAGAVGIAMALAGMGVWSLVANQLVQPVVATLVVWRACSWRPRASFSRAHLLALMPFVMGMLGSRALLALDTVIPRLAIGYTMGAPAVGQFALAKKITELLNQLLIRPLARVAIPGFAAYAGRPDKIATLLQRTAELGALVVCPSFAGLAFVAPDLIPLALGPQWLPSVPVIQVFALMAAITPLVWLQGALMCGIGRADIQLTMGAASTVALLAGLALVWPLSLVAFAAVMVARSYLVFPLYLFLMQKTNGIDPRTSVGTSLRPILASLLMLGALFGASSLLPGDLHRSARVAIFVIIGSLTYGAALLVLARPLILGLIDVLRPALSAHRRAAPRPLAAAVRNDAGAAAARGNR